MIGIVNASVSPDMKKLIIYLLLFGVFQLNAEKRHFLPKPPKPDKPEVDKSNFGQWLDKDGYVTEGPKIKNWIDTDRDRIDDRLQAGPGKTAGKKRPDVVRPKPEPKPKPKPVRPTKPTRPNTEENKPTRPQRPSRPELPTELKDKMGAYKKEMGLSGEGQARELNRLYSGQVGVGGGGGGTTVPPVVPPVVVPSSNTVIKVPIGGNGPST